MSDKTIKQLPTEFTTLQPDDWFIAQRDSDSETGKVKASNVFGGGWNPLSAAPSAVTHNGNRSYNLTFSNVDLTGIVSKGMRLRLTRTVTAPTQCADLEASSSQYLSKSSPTGLSFTDDFTVVGWVRPESYVLMGIMARRNADTEGWTCRMNANGTVELQGLRIAGNNRSITTYTSLPLGKKTHIAASLDMSGNTGTIWFDGIAQPTFMTTGGTATALVQGTTALVVGAQRSNGSDPWDGELNQVAVFSSLLSEATVRALMNQTLTGSESTLCAGYTLSNSVNDLSANVNHLTAQNGATTTTTDSPFAGGNVQEFTDGTTEMAIVMDISFSTHTTMVVQAPEGYAIPTSGGISAAYYSTQKIPYGFPSQKGKWTIETLIKSDRESTSTTAGTWYNHAQISIPVGEWDAGYDMPYGGYEPAATEVQFLATLSAANNTESDPRFTDLKNNGGPNGTIVNRSNGYKKRPLSLSAQTIYYFNQKSSVNADSQLIPGASVQGSLLAENAYL